MSYRGTERFEEILSDGSRRRMLDQQIPVCAILPPHGQRMDLEMQGVEAFVNYFYRNQITPKEETVVYDYRDHVRSQQNGIKKQT